LNLSSKEKTIKIKNKYKLQWKTVYENESFNSKIAKELRVQGVPYGRLLDKEGVIINKYVTYYSHKELIDMLEKLLSKSD